MKTIQVNIAEPCHENWNQMLPHEQGKFCLSCQKPVVDFTVMSDRELLNYFKSNTSNSCGRFNDDQLNKPITVAAQRSIGKWKYFWQFLLPAVFAMNRANGQTKMDKMPPEVCPTSSFERPAVQMTEPLLRIMVGGYSSKMVVQKDLIIIRGHAVDENGTPLAGASISSADDKFHAVCDGVGNFSLSLTKAQDFNISYIGYKRKTIPYKSLPKMEGFVSIRESHFTKISGITISLQAADAALMGDVVIVRNYKPKSPTKSFFSFLRKTEIQKTPEASLKIFPNPIPAGQDFKIDLSVAKKAAYALEIFSASGKSIQAKSIIMQNLQQTITVDGQQFHEAGVYVVHLVDAENKIVYNGKLVVQ
ncbi:MAG: carboxypeptidase-like regulatory domain-containing protein [Chitinophagaceae bacterium]